MLVLPIKKVWFDMIKSGIKKEEYRDIKPYYTTRFKKLWGDNLEDNNKEVDILFRNGYSNNSPSFVARCSICVKEGNPNWGAIEGTKYYTLKIKEILNENSK